MKAIATAIALQYDAARHAQLVVTLQAPHDIVDLQAAVKSGKLLNVEIKQYRKVRSVNSNAYMWILLDKLAAALHTTKDELYLEVLSRYGVFTHIVVKPEAVERVKAEWRTVRELGKGMIGKVEGVQLQVYYGSSGYNSLEMARLIDGVVSECKECGVETLPPDEIARMNSEWGR